MNREGKETIPSSKNEGVNNKKKDFFGQKLATLLLVQIKLLPPSALGIKDLKSNI